ncbi:MAG: phosphomannomutase [Thermodesulfovibrionales bacterium]
MVGKFSDATSCWKEILSDPFNKRDLLRVIEAFARDNKNPARIIFGTSGWRGEIGTDFTFNNVRIVTMAIIEMFRSNDRSVMDSMGVKDFEDIKRRGVIVGHDNRFLGRDFAMEVIGLLQKEGIRTWYAGEATTPEFSAGIEMIDAACSINLTPSHNPANYAGLKFNPSDGGPAGTEITSIIEDIANRMMNKATIIPPSVPVNVDRIDLTDLYMKYLNERGTIDLERIRDYIRREDCIVCIDHVHGATRGRIERIVGVGANEKMRFLRTDNDYLFGGVAPEPSEKNMEGVMNMLKGSTARFKLGAIMDPDGDRIRHADGHAQIPMNYFGAMAFHYLYKYRNIRGVVAKSVGTSNLVNAIAGKLGVSVKETKVGFKHFRPYLLRTSKERAIVAFEESDGISGYNHTLEKDAIFGLLLAIEMMAVTGKNLSEYLRDIMDEFGYYYPDRAGIGVDRSLTGEPLIRRLSVIKDRYKEGTAVMVGNKMRRVIEVITVDGTKIVFDDGSWMMIRPSGTEPKVRFYIEARNEEDKRAIFDLAEKITTEAIRT